MACWNKPIQSVRPLPRETGNHRGHTSHGDNPRPCQTTGCKNRYFCKGLCRVCYNRTRKERLEGRRQAPISGCPEKKREQIENELAEAEGIYNRVCGVENRIRWRKKITLLQEELESVGKG